MLLFKKIFGFTLSGGDKLELPTADGSADQVLKTDGSGNLDWVNNSGGGSVWGTEYHSAEDNSDSLTGVTLQEKLKLTTGTVAAGDYYIGWNYQWKFNSTSNDFLGIVELDDTTELMRHQQEPQDGGADQGHQLSGFAIVTLSAAVHTVDIDFGRGGSQGSGTIFNARLILYRVS